jgi:hypothetical protein
LFGPLTKSLAKLHESSGFCDLILSALPTFFKGGDVIRIRKPELSDSACGATTKTFAKLLRLHESSGFRDLILSALPTFSKSPEAT